MRSLSINKTVFSVAEERSGTSLIISAPCAVEDVPKHGIVEVDPSGRVTSFLEKPAVTETQSRKQSPCFYLLSRTAVSGLKAESNNISSVVLISSSQRQIQKPSKGPCRGGLTQIQTLTCWILTVGLPADLQ